MLWTTKDEFHRRHWKHLKGMKIPREKANPFHSPLLPFQTCQCTLRKYTSFIFGTPIQQGGEEGFTLSFCLITLSSLLGHYEPDPQQEKTAGAPLTSTELHWFTSAKILTEEETGVCTGVGLSGFNCFCFIPYIQVAFCSGKCKLPPMARLLPTDILSAYPEWSEGMSTSKTLQQHSCSASV